MSGASLRDGASTGSIYVRLGGLERAPALRCSRTARGFINAVLHVLAGGGQEQVRPPRVEVMPVALALIQRGRKEGRRDQMHDRGALERPAREDEEAGTSSSATRGRRRSSKSRLLSCRPPFHALR